MPNVPNEDYLDAPKKDQQNAFEILNELRSVSGNFFQTSSVQELLDSFKDRENFTNRLAKIQRNITQDAKANKYPSMANSKVELIAKIDAHARKIKRLILRILKNDSLKENLRKLTQMCVKLREIQKNLCNYLTEEQITVAGYERLNSGINKGVERLYSEPIHEIYKQDAQTILNVGITDTDFPYLQDLRQLNSEVSKLTQDQVANYLILAAEKLIEQNARSEQMTFSNAEELGLNADSSYKINVNEETFPLLYTTDSEVEVIDLILNGADPINESKFFTHTPLEHQLACRYLQRQSLNILELDSLAIKENKPKDNLFKYSKDKLNQIEKSLKRKQKELTNKLEKKEKLIKVHMRAMILKDTETDLSAYTDIFVNKKHLLFWKDLKLEVEAMKQISLTPHCTVYNFLTEPLEKLTSISGVSERVLESVIVKFPHYKQELDRQKENMRNFCVVQGPFQEMEQRPNLNPVATNYLSQSVQQDASVGVSSNEESELNKQSIAQKKKSREKKSSPRLTSHSTFFYDLEGHSLGRDVKKGAIPRSSRLTQRIV